jgi:hypothetical protein
MRPQCPFYQAAVAANASRYFTGKPCRHGHVAPRYTCNRVCLECNAEQSLKWAQGNIDAKRASSRRYQATRRSKAALEIA